jgi:hypothetical protein
MVKRSIAALLAAGALAAGCSTPPPEKSAAPATRPAGVSWLGVHENSTNDANGSVTVSVVNGTTEVIVEVSQSSGCVGGVAGTLELHETRATLTPPLFTQSGREREPSTDSCQLDFELHPDSSITVNEKQCDAYHGAACPFAGDYHFSRAR